MTLFAEGKWFDGIIKVFGLSTLLTFTKNG